MFYKTFGYVLASVLLGASLNVTSAQSDKDVLNLEADSVEYDYERGSSLYRGNVKVDQGTMSLTGDTVEIFTDNGEPNRIVVDSELSTFKDILADKPFYVEAEHIDYNRADRMIRLRGSIKIDYDGKVLRSERAIYDLSKRIIVAPKSNERVRLTIDPTK